MRKLLIVSLLALCSEAFGQAAYSGILTAQSTTSVGNPLTTVVVPAPGASIVVYGFGTLVKSSVCPDSTLVGCSAIAPNNPITADARGNFSFYIAAGAYDYTITPVGGATQGPYHIFLPMGITTPSTINLGSLIVSAAQGGTGANNTATSGKGLKGNGTTFVTTSVAPGGSGTLTCTNQFARVINVNADAVPTGTCATVGTGDVSSAIAQTGVDINTSNQVTATHLASALPVAQGGTGVTTSTGSGNTVLSTSPSLTTPTMSAPTITGTASLANATMSGTVTNYNGIGLVSNGIASELATIDLTTQGASIGAATLYAVPSSGAGMYRVSCYAIVTRAATTSSTLPACNVLWIDKDGGASVNAIVAASNAGNALTTLTQGTVVISVQASSTIQYSTSGFATSGGTSMQYAVHLKIEAM